MFETFTSAEVEAVLSPAEEPSSAQESAAVTAFVSENNNSEDAPVVPRDLEVGTLNVGDGFNVTVVAPENGVEIRSVQVVVDAGSDEVSLGARFESDPAVEAQQNGPGMGTWPGWTNQPSSEVQLKLFKGGDYLGRALFETKRRQFENDGTTARDTWQVARWAQAIPEDYDILGSFVQHMYVKKLWISSDLTTASQEKAQQNLPSSTKPQIGSSSCVSGTSMDLDIFSFTWQNCEDYDVWVGDGVTDIGHMRFDYDQGAYAGGNTRSIAYINAFTVDNGHTPSLTWYEFVTLQSGNMDGDPAYRLYKCVSDSKGTTGGAENLVCNW
jgi:hypothetical protein